MSDALDEGLRVLPAFTSDDTQQELGGGDGARTGILDLTALQEGDEQLDGGVDMLCLVRFEKGVERGRLARDWRGHGGGGGDFSQCSFLLVAAD